MLARLRDERRGELVLPSVSHLGVVLPPLLRPVALHGLGEPLRADHACEESDGYERDSYDGEP